MKSTPELYKDVELYDLLHADGTDDEVWLLERIAEKHGCGIKTALEPACGTGRYLAGLLRRGWNVEGYDLSASMRAFARKRVLRWGERARIVPGDMRTYRSTRKFGLIFNLLSTFRHLMTDQDARRHLRSVAAMLAPGGIFVLGLDLTDYASDESNEEVWNCGRGKKRVRHVMISLPANSKQRRERIINFVTVAKGKKERVFESAYDLRSYNADELAALIGSSPLRVAAVYGYDGRPAELGGPERSLWLVMKSRRD